MESHDRLPEERIGSIGMIRKRAAEVEALAEACDAEADEQEQGVNRLRERAKALRMHAEEYLLAALAIDGPPVITGVHLVEEFARISDSVRITDIVFVRDPVDASTYRMYRWNEIDQRWARKAL